MARCRLGGKGGLPNQRSTNIGCRADVRRHTRGRRPQKYSTQSISASVSNSEDDQKRNELATVRLADYSSCGHTNLSVELVASFAAAMELLSEAGRCGELAC
jgi:hypothetical protein